MMEPYAQFLVDFTAKHADLVHRNAPENTKAAVIVETRRHFFLPKVIRNVMFYLGEGWNLHVLTGEPTLGYVRAALPGWQVGIHPFLPGAVLPRWHYNTIMMTADFWKAFSEEKILIFQTDSLLCGDNIDEFMDYDLIGATCGSFDENYYANGGLSLRNRELMLECVARRAPHDDEPEDVFFSTEVRALGGKMADVHTAARFAVESTYLSHPVGVHATDKFMHDVEVARRIVADTRY